MAALWWDRGMTADEKTRLLYLVRHAEPRPDGSGLTPAGTEQAEHLGRRLAQLSVGEVMHGPLPRAAETARVAAVQFDHPPSLSEADVAGDYVPSVPATDEVPSAWADTVMSTFADVSEEEAHEGAALGSRAIERLAGPATDGRKPVEIVITHAFTISWLVRDALDAPHWRWWGPIQCHAGLTVIMYPLDGPPSVMVSNDVTHLPPELRWTGFPGHLRV